MARAPDPTNLKYAHTLSAVKAVEDLALLHADRAAESRYQWPALWERLDALFGILHEPAEP